MFDSKLKLLVGRVEAVFQATNQLTLFTFKFLQNISTALEMFSQLCGISRNTGEIWSQRLNLDELLQSSMESPIYVFVNIRIIQQLKNNYNELNL